MILKTLKDLRSYADTEAEIVVSQEELKQEANKWIKDLEEFSELHPHLEDTVEDNKAIVYWIKDFFNITDEDLK